MSQQQQQQSRGLTQSKEALLKSYTMRLKDDIKAMLDNFTEVIKLARVGQKYMYWDKKKMESKENSY